MIFVMYFLIYFLASAEFIGGGKVGVDFNRKSNVFKHFWIFLKFFPRSS